MNFKANFELVMDDKNLNCEIYHNSKASICRKLSDVDRRKKHGVYLTNNEISLKVAKKLKNEIKSGNTIIDPACGAGDLLLACSKISDDYWFDRKIKDSFYGIDIYDEFLEITKARLQTFGGEPRNKLPNNFICGDALKNIEFINKADCILTNPPYLTKIIKDEEVDWAAGALQYSGYFVWKIIKNLKKGKRFIAILPDVLRSGARYEKWRREIELMTKSLKVEVVGNFGSSVQVDVFILDCIKGGKSNQKLKNKWHITENPTKKNLGDVCSVSVGPVVDYRDPKKGAYYPFIDAKNIGVDLEICSNHISSKRRFSKKVIKAPFIVARRTSSPLDKKRLRMTLIKGTSEVAVENHLIVIKPKDNKYKTCKDLMLELNSEKHDKWVNNRLRCRHLTVSALKEMPIR